MNFKRKSVRNILSMVMVICLVLSFSTMTLFADDNVSVTIQNALERPNPDGTPAQNQNTNNESIDSISTNSVSFNTITPVFIRSGNTTTVQVYLCYNGTDAANAIKFNWLHINNTSLLLPKTYTSFPAKTYNFGVISNYYNVYIGNATIPTNVTKVRVSDNGVMAYQIQYGWNSFSNIIGEWPIQ